MSDGEKMVWAAAFARALDKGKDAPEAAEVASSAVKRLRAIVGGGLTYEASLMLIDMSAPVRR
jgi:hypothetical protein